MDTSSGLEAASYARISQKVERDKVADQHAQNERHAKARGYRIVARYTDDGIGALGDKVRPDFERMLTDAATAGWRVIVATEEERLARNVEEKLELHAACEDAGVVWDTIRDGFVDPSTDSGEFISTIRAAVGKIESRRKVRRQRAASDERAAEGAPTVRPGYGYVRDNGVDVVVEEEAAIIVEAAERILDGWSIRSVAADLNQRGIPSPRTVERARKAARGGQEPAGESIPWSPATVRQMLRRPSLAGMRTHRGAVVGSFNPDLHAAILDRDTHDRLVALFDDPTRSPSSRVGHPPTHLLSGIARCGRCGDTLGGRMKRIPPWAPKPGRTGKPVKAAYACGTCFKVRRLQEPVDALVTEVLLRRLEREDAADLFTAGDPDAVRSLRGAIAAVSARLASAADMFADGTIDGAQLARITAKGRGEREALEARLSAALPPALPRDAVGARARAAWAGYDMERRRAILGALMQITILPGGVGQRGFDPELVRIDWLADAG